MRIVLIAHAACTHCPLGPPTSQLRYLMIRPRRQWKKPIIWPVASVVGPPGMWEWLINQLVGADWSGLNYFQIKMLFSRLVDEEMCFGLYFSLMIVLSLTLCWIFFYYSQWWMARTWEPTYSAGRFPPVDVYILSFTCSLILYHMFFKSNTHT